MLVTALVLSVVMSPKEESMSDGEALAVKAPFILSAVAVLAGGATVAQVHAVHSCVEYGVSSME